MSWLEWVSLVAAALFLSFVPGFSLSYLFLSDGKATGLLERTAISIALSLGIVPLVLLGLSFLFGVPITTVSVLSIGLALTVGPYALQRMARGRSSHARATVGIIRDFVRRLIVR